MKKFSEKLNREMERIEKDAERIVRSVQFDGLRERVVKAIAALEKKATEINTLTQIIESTYHGSTAPEVEELSSTNEKAKNLFIKAREQEALVRNSNHSSTIIEDAAKTIQETMTKQMQILLTKAQTLKQAIDALPAAPAVMPNTLHHGDDHNADHDDSDGDDDHTDKKAASVTLETPTQSTIDAPVVTPTTIAQPMHNDDEAAANAQRILEQLAARVAELERQLRTFELEQELAAARAQTNNANNAAPVRFNNAPAANEGTQPDPERCSNRSPKNN